MKILRCAFMVVLIGGIMGCGLMDSQLSRGPGGEPSRLEQEVKAAQPVLGPYGALATVAATLAASVYGAFRAHQADKQTDAPKA